MSVSSITELPGKTGEQTLEGRQYNRMYDVVTTDKDDSQKVIFDILGTAVGGVTIPLPGQEHPDDDTVIVKGVKPVQDVAVRTLWHVHVSYVTRQSVGGDIGTTQTKPTDLPPQITFGSNRYSRELTRSYGIGDDRGNPTVPVRNAVGDPFDPQPMVDLNNMVITIVRNETVEDFDPNDTIFLYENTINANAITIASVAIGVEEGKMVSINANKKWDFEGEAYYEVTYQIELSQENHIISVLNRGFYTKAGDDDRRRIMESDVGTVVKGKDRPVSEPQLLTAAGALLPDGDAAVWRSFQPWWSISWADLDLPATD